MNSTFDIFSIKTVPPTYSWDKGTPNLDYNEFVTDLSACTVLGADNEEGVEFVGYAPFSFICLSSAPGDISNSHLAIKRTAAFGDYYNHQTNLVTTPTLSNELFCHAYIMPGRYTLEYTKTEYIEVTQKDYPAFGVCLQKHCIDWSWKNLKSTATTALSVTWSQSKKHNRYEKKWRFEFCENDWASLNGLHVHRLDTDAPQLWQWYNFNCTNENKNRYNTAVPWMSTGFQKGNQLTWAGVSSPCINLRQYEQVIWRWDNISNNFAGILPEEEDNPECFLTAVIDKKTVIPFTQENSSKKLEVPCDKDAEYKLTFNLLSSGEVYDLIDQEIGDYVYLDVDPPPPDTSKKALDTSSGIGRDVGNRKITAITWDQTKLSQPFNVTWDCIRSNCVTTLAPLVSSGVQKITKKKSIRIIEIPPQVYINTVNLEDRTMPLTVRLTPRHTICGSFPIEKIVWDLGDGSPLLVQRRWSNTLEEPFVFSGAIPEDYQDPRNFDVIHTYNTLPNIGYSFYPSITAYTSSTNTSDCASCIVGPVKKIDSSKANVKVFQTEYNDYGKVLVGQIENNIAIWRADK